jgi:membrane protease YdiL (CAAX protease family)
MNALGLTRNASAAAEVFALPFAPRLRLVLRAAVVEETLFRGYPIERLTEILGNKWAAVLIPMVLFTAARVPFWGLAQAIPVVLASILMTLLYIWKRDLGLNIVAHLVIDGLTQD